MMATLIVDQRGAQLSLAGSGILCIQYGDDVVHRIGLNSTRQLVLVGEVALSTGVLRACLSAGLDVVLLPRRGRTPALHLLPSAATGTALRHAQCVVCSDQVQRFSLAQRLVSANIERQSLWLIAHGIAPNLERFSNTATETADIAALWGKRRCKRPLH